MAKIIIDDRAFRKLERELDKAQSQSVRVGVLSTKGGTEKHPDAPITMIELAAIHEFGAPQAGIPERSFIRSAFESNDEFKAFATKLVTAIVDGRMTVDRAYQLLGEWGIGQVRDNITKRDIPPPLKPETVQKKGSRKPLVDTGRLLQSIQWEID